MNKEIMGSELTIFNYGFNKVRTITKGEEPWFVLKDVCDILEIKNVTQTAERLDDDERSMFCIGRQGSTNIVSESGLYKVIFRSNKPEAKKFKKWVTSEVLPSIRKTGSYSLAPKTYIEALKALITAEEEKIQLAQKNTELEIKLDQEMQYYTVKRVAKINQIHWKSLDWRCLKKASQLMEREIKKTFDANFESVNAYHIDVWRHEYPHLRYA